MKFNFSRALPYTLFVAITSIALLVPSHARAADVITVTNPGSGTPALSGSSTILTATCVNGANPCADVLMVGWQCGLYACYNPGIDGPTSIGVSITPPFNYNFNSYWYGNGALTISAIAYNALGSAVATSAAVPITISNNWPNPNNLSMTVTPGVAWTSPWSVSACGGPCTLAIVLSGTNASTDSFLYSCFVDGVKQVPASNPATGGVYTCQVYTQNFSNLTPHNIYVEVTDCGNNPGGTCNSGSTVSGGTVYPADLHYVPGINEGAAPLQVTFANSGPAIASQTLVTSGVEVYGAPGNNTTVTAETLNTDGTDTAGTPVCGAVGNTSVATTTLACTVSFVQTGSTWMYAMIPVVTITDLAAGPLGSQVQSSAKPFGGMNVMSSGGAGGGLYSSLATWACNITGGTGTGTWTPGFYQFADWGGLYIGLSSVAATANATGGQATCGPARQIWLLVNSVNPPVPCFSKNGTIYSNSSGPNASCYSFHELFGDGNSLSLIPTSGGYICTLGICDQLYNSRTLGLGMGAVDDYSHSALNTFEISGSPVYQGSSWTGTEPTGGYTSYHGTILPNFIAGVEGMLANVTGSTVFLSWDNIFATQAGIYAVTTGPASTWAIPPLQDALSQWGLQGNAIASSYWSGADEWTWGYKLLQGPTTYGVTSQSWLDHMVCTGGGGSGEVCELFGTNIVFGGAANFIIHGSSVTNLNNVVGSVWTCLPGFQDGNSTCSFDAPNVPDGTYGTGGTADSGLALEQFAAAWVGVSSAFYNPYTAMAMVWQQYAAASSPKPAVACYPVGTSSTEEVQACAGNSNAYTQTLLGVTQVANYAGLYTPAAGGTYLTSRQPAQKIMGLSDLVGVFRHDYGNGYNPAQPLVAGNTNSSQGTYYGFQSFAATVTGCSGSTITFSSAPVLPTYNVLSGVTKLTVSGVTDNAGATDTCDGMYYVQSWGAGNLSANVTMAVPDFTTSGMNSGGGVINFSGGSQFSLATAAGGPFGVNVVNTGATGQGIIASTVQHVGITPGFIFDYCTYMVVGCASNPPAGALSTFGRLRGQNFTLASTIGTGNSSLNSRTFLLVPENPATLPSSGGGFPTRWVAREYPVFNCCMVAGTAAITVSGTHNKGPAGPSNDLNDPNPGWAAGESAAVMQYGAAAERNYQNGYTFNGIAQYGGYIAVGTSAYFPPYTSITSQIYQNQHWEDVAVVAYYHAHNQMGLLWNRTSPFRFQTHLNSPDCTAYVYCTAVQGPLGSIYDALNVIDAPVSLTSTLTPYETSGQSIVRYWTQGLSGITTTTVLAPATPTDTVVLQSEDLVTYVFPVTFAGYLNQPAVSNPRLADVAGAATVVVRYAYDSYYLDAAIGNSYNCGSTFPCFPPWDRNIGLIYYRLIYLNSAGKPVDITDIQTF